MKEYSDHQKKIIKRYYDNRDDIDFRRLSEIASDLYLATRRRKPTAYGSRRPRS